MYPSSWPTSCNSWTTNQKLFSGMYYGLRWMGRDFFFNSGSKFLSVLYPLYLNLSSSPCNHSTRKKAGRAEGENDGSQEQQTSQESSRVSILPHAHLYLHYVCRSTPSPSLASTWMFWYGFNHPHDASMWIWSVCEDFCSVTSGRALKGYHHITVTSHTTTTYGEHFTFLKRGGEKNVVPNTRFCMILLRSARSAVRVKCSLFPGMNQLYLVIF